MDNVKIHNDLDATCHELQFYKEMAEDRLNCLKSANEVYAKLHRALVNKAVEVLAMELKLEDMDSRITAVTRTANAHAAILEPLERQCRRALQAYSETDGLASLLFKVALDLNDKNCVALSPKTKHRILRVVGRNAVLTDALDKENDVSREGVSELPGQGGMPKSSTSSQVMSSLGLYEDNDRTCYYELCGGGTSVGDIGQFEKPLNEGNILRNQPKRRKTTVLSPDLGKQTQQLLVGTDKRSLPLVSTPYPFAKKIMKKLSQSSPGSMDKDAPLMDLIDDKLPEDSDDVYDVDELEDGQ